MRARIPVAIGALVLVFAALACERGAQHADAPRERAGAAHEREAAAADHQDAAAADQEAAAAPVADWCAGHRVPESACTLCNPSLIPEFKARGDWCAEHELPESICPLCHPDRVRPPAGALAPHGGEAGPGGTPADGTRIKVATGAAARTAGFETSAAAAAQVAPTVEATAVLVGDPARMAVVNARVPGVVRRIAADIGTRVVSGATLAVIESAEVAADVSMLAAARARVEATQAACRREEALFDRGISSARAVEKAREEWAAARAEVEALGAALDLAGAGADAPGRQVLISPITGIVTERHAVLGKFVDPAESLFAIVDPAVLWAEIDVPEADAARVRPGQSVEITVGAGGASPAPALAATLTYVAPIIDPATRTARARARLDNRDGLLRANTYARARIFVEADSGVVLVPRSALQEVNGVHLVFVELSAGEYETRRVVARPAARHPDLIAIGAGLRPGEAVVTTGSFLLLTETLKESLGLGCCEVGPPAPRKS